MHKIYRSELDGCSTVGDKLTDCYRNIWQVTKTHPEHIIAAKIQQNYNDHITRRMGRIRWNPTIRRDDAQKLLSQR